MGNHKPIPYNKIIERLSGFFEELSKGKSGSIVGTYKTIKSGLLRYIIGNRSEFTDYIPENIVFVFYEPTPIISDNPYYWLHQLSIAISQADPTYEHKVTEDTAVLLGGMQKYITDLSKSGKRLVILFYRIEELKDVPQKAAEALMSLYRTQRIVTSPGCSFWFLVDCVDPLEQSSSPFIQKLAYPMSDSIIYFPDFDEEETNYWIDIFVERSNLKINDNTRKKLATYCGGNYSLLYDTFIILQEKGFTGNWTERLANSPIITSYLDEYIKRFSLNNQRLIMKYSKGQIQRKEVPILNRLDITSKLLFDYCANLSEDYIAKSGISMFTGRELQLYEYLSSKKNTLVSREEVQDILWKNNSEDFSLWAQDKVISRLRRKIKFAGKSERLVTVKNRGVMLWDDSVR